MTPNESTQSIIWGDVQLGEMRGNQTTFGRPPPYESTGLNNMGSTFSGKPCKQQTTKNREADLGSPWQRIFFWGWGINHSPLHGFRVEPHGVRKRHSGPRCGASGPAGGGLGSGAASGQEAGGGGGGRLGVLLEGRKELGFWRLGVLCG